jgi:beta-N-acetylglucosaminidase
MNKEAIKRDIQTKGGKFRYKVLRHSIFASLAEIRKAEKKKSLLENSGWNLFESNQMQSLYVKEA